jgi:hypothetical protein
MTQTIVLFCGVFAVFSRMDAYILFSFSSFSKMTVCFSCMDKENANDEIKTEDPKNDLYGTGIIGDFFRQYVPNGCDPCG